MIIPANFVLLHPFTTLLYDYQIVLPICDIQHFDVYQPKGFPVYRRQLFPFKELEQCGITGTKQVNLAILTLN
jgi:hypothetical protein